MSKHTPGPWKWISADRGSLLVTGEETALILQTTKKVEDRNNTDTPDARLIAAAPEMLEALKYYFRVLEEVNGPDWNKRPDHVLSKMITAAAKAEVTS